MPIRAGACKSIHERALFSMLRWFIVIFLAVIVFSAALPWLEKLGIGRLPGDFRFRIFGRTVFLPFASTVLLSLLVFLLVRLF